MSRLPDDVAIRRAIEEDHLPIVGLVDEWFGRRVQAQLPRLWFRHFATTSRVSITPNGRRVGFAVGFVGPDRPDHGVLHLVAVAPSLRRRGVGAALVAAVAEALRAQGARRLGTTWPPGEPVALAFLRAVGFEVEESSRTVRLYGTPAYPDWNREGDDQVVLNRPL